MFALPMDSLGLQTNRETVSIPGCISNTERAFRSAKSGSRREGRPPSQAAAGPAHRQRTRQAGQISQRGWGDSYLHGLPWKPCVFSPFPWVCWEECFENLSLHPASLHSCGCVQPFPNAPLPLPVTPLRSCWPGSSVDRGTPGGAEKKEHSEDLKYDRDRDGITGRDGVFQRAVSLRG